MSGAPTKWCSCCKTNRPVADFLTFANRATRVTYCSACAKANMASYWASRPSGEGLKKAAMESRA